MLLEEIKKLVKNYIPLAGNKIKREDHVNANDKIIEELYYFDWGIPKPYLGTVLPDGYVWCDGTTPTVLRSDCHAKFIEAMSTNYPGDGSTTIDIPIIKPGSSLIQAGTDITSGVRFTQGDKGGEVKHLLTTTETPIVPHTHTLKYDKAYQRTESPLETASGAYGIQVSAIREETISTISTSTNSPVAHNNMSPYFVVKYILRYA